MGTLLSLRAKSVVAGCHRLGPRLRKKILTSPFGFYWGYTGDNGKENGNCYNELYGVFVKT